MAVNNNGKNYYEYLNPATSQTTANKGEVNSSSLFSDNSQTQTQTNQTIEEPDTSLWETIEPKKDKILFWETDSYTYTLKDGTKFEVKDIEGVEVKYNPETGEIFISGAKDGTIKCSNNGSKVSIYNSTIDNIEGGKKSDVIGVYGSYVNGKIDGKSDDDIITIINSVTEEINSSTGDDDLIIDNSTAKNVNTSKGNDKITVSNSNVKTINSSTGDDTINVSNSDIQTIDTGKDNDNLVIENSKVETIDTKKGQNNVAINDNSTVNNTNKNDKTEVENIKDFDFKYETMDDKSIELSTNTLNSKTSLYTNKNLTEEEQYQALTIDFFTQNLDNIQAQFDEQNKSDGVVNNSFNFVKELTDLGVSKEDINNAINEQKQMIDEMKAALNKEGKETFEEVFKKWTGIEYNKENLEDYLQNAQMYSLAVNGFAKTESFKQALSNGKNLNDVLEAYTNYFGSEEKGREELNKLLEIVPKHPEVFAGVISVKINEDNKLVTVRTDEMDTMGNYPENSTYETVDDLGDLVNLFKTMPRIFDSDKYSTDYKNNLEKTLGCSFETLQNKYVSSQLKTFGSGSSYQKLIDKYCQSQEGFKDKLASACQIGGIGLMVVGGVTTFVCPPAGVALMEAGKYTAIGGMFGDNVLDLVDSLSSENGISKEESWNLFKETVTEIALLYSGAKINQVSGSVKDIVLTETQNKILSQLASIGTDATLSLLSDLVITGEIDLTGEGISQLLGIITGLAGAKVNEYNKNVVKTASDIYSSGDVNAAMKYLKEQGVSKKVSNKLLNQWLDSEYETIFKMSDDGIDYNKIMEYAKGRAIFGKKELEIIKQNIGVRRTIGKLNDEFNINYKQELKGIDFTSAQGKAIASDIELLYKAKVNDVDVNDLLVPSMDNVNSALKNLKIGDVFEVNGQDGTKTLYLKTQEGTAEALNISKDAYCRLFPAVDRYTAGQQASGDCYLVSALNTTMADPKARNYILQCFSEDAKGNITVKSPTSDSTIMIKPDQTIEDLDVISNKAMSSSLGMQLVEYLYKYNLSQDTINTLTKKINRHQSELLKIYNEDSLKLKENNINSYEDFMEYLEKTETQTRAKIEQESGVSLDDESWFNIVQTLDVVDGYLVSNGVLTEKGLNTYGKLLGINDNAKVQKLYTQMLKPIKSNVYAFEQNYYLNSAENNLVKCNSSMLSPEEAGGNGGCSHDVFKFFGIDEYAKWETPNNSSTLEMLIEHPELQEKYLITAGTAMTKDRYLKLYNDTNCPQYEKWHENPDAFNELVNNAPDKILDGLVVSHAYSFEFAVNEAGEQVIKVTNPWASANSSNKTITLTIDEFKENFSQIYIAQIEN